MIEITCGQIDSAWLDTEGAQTENDVQSILERFIESLSKEQRIALVEEIGLSVVEWVEFDASEITTHPVVDAMESARAFLAKTNQGTITVFYSYWNKTFQSMLTGDDIGMDGFEVYAYCELPQRKESKS